MKKLQGAMTAIVTPFENNRIDIEGYKKLIERQLSAGINGIIPVGTTGESATLNFTEHQKVIDTAVETVAGTVPVIAGAGANSTSEAVSLTKYAKKSGADYVLSVCPYYNKPTQEGLYRHFSEIAECGIPVILYNVPSRTGSDIAPDTVARLSENSNIVAIKEASGSIKQATEILLKAKKGFTVLSGDDFMTLPLISIGAKGVISVTSNVWPEAIVSLTDAALSGNFEEAKKINKTLYMLHKAMFIETNPIPVKTACAMLGLVSEEVRLPLYKLSDRNIDNLKSVLTSYGLLK
ncbi:MAG: 4-hydroxy-tetrahydrodipicolinate synthase [Epsilonproteobacteria bacterium]|nr:4-hydroxy-tetrahydrodipicolinate synthase [Campylobacterota bacterium]